MNEPPHVHIDREDSTATPGYGETMNRHTPYSADFDGAQTSKRARYMFRGVNATGTGLTVRPYPESIRRCTLQPPGVERCA